MGRLSLLVLVLVWATNGLLLTAGQVQPPLRVGTWNVQDFGKTKMGKAAVVDVIVKVMQRFDLICILEIVDISENVPSELLEALNAGLNDTYTFVLSQRVGTSSAKEQYGCYWKPSRVVKVLDYQFNDTAERFSYDPFGVVVEVVVRHEKVRFGLVTVHTRPSLAEKEIDALTYLYDDFKTMTGVDDLMIAGDYNAGCTFVTGKEWPSISLWTDPRFSWLISHHIDTTTKDTTCPYDRIVVAGSKLPSYVYVNSAQPFYFNEDENFNLTSQEELEDVSDHYPVEVLLPGGVPDEVAKLKSPSLAVSMELEATPVSILDMNKDLGGACSAGVHGAVVVTWSSASASVAMDSLSTFSNKYPNVVSQEAVLALRYKVEQGVLQDTTLYGQWQDPGQYRITLVCITSQGTCTLSLSAPTALN